MSTKTGPCKALIAFGLCGTAVLVATDNYWLAREAREVSDLAEQIGLEADSNEKPGLYLFEGEGSWHTHVDMEGFKEVELEFDGKTRPVKMEELPALLEMEPKKEPSCF